MFGNNTQHKLIAVNPATKEKLGEVIITSDIPEVMRVARRNTEFLRLNGTRSIKAFLSAVGAVISQKEREIVEKIILQTGKPVAEVHYEVFAVTNTIKFLLETVDALHAEHEESIKTFVPEGGRYFIAPKSIGVVLVVTSFDFAFGISMTNILFALAAGCSVVLKPSPEVPLIGEIIRDVLGEAARSVDLPESLIQVAQGGLDCAKSLIDLRPDKVMFAGSTQSGRVVGAMCAERFIPHVLELSAKNPAVILEDSDLGYTVQGIRYGAFLSSGQACASIGKVFVPKKFYDEFVAKLIRGVVQLRQGDPFRYDTDLGPLATKSHFERVTRFVREARVHPGSRIACGGEPNDALAGFYYEPTVVEVRNLANPFWNEEIFGPVIPVAPYVDLEAVIDEINRSKYGLQASIWTKDIEKARSIAKQIDAGTVFINDANYSYVIPELPWGGVKDSGYGISHSLYGLAEFIRPMNINITAEQNQFPYRWFPYGKDNLR